MNQLLAPDRSLPAATAAGARLDPIRALIGQPAVRRALPALGGAMALLMAGSAWYAFQTPAQRTVFEGLADADKAAVAEALQSAGMSFAVDRTTGAVTVGETDFHQARMLLASRGLPKAAPSGDSMLSALPMGASRAVEGETLRGAREADLSRTIEAIEAVKTAKVHLAVPEPSPFLRDSGAPAASVMLTLQSGRSLGEAQVRAIGHLVASAVPGLDAKEVSIVDQNGALLSQRNTPDDQRIALQTQIEDRARRALTALLGPMVGAQNFTAEIHADLDLSESQSTRETYPKDDRALRREEGNKTTGTTTPPPAVGIPGALSNVPPPPTTAGTTPTPVPPPPAAGTPSSDETYARTFDVGREISVTRQPTGRLRRLTVAVALRDVKGTRGRSPQEIAAIESLVKGAVGFDAARGDVVAIASRPFAETAPEEPVAFYDQPWFSTLLRQGGALLAALLVFLFVGRPLLRSFKARAAAAESEKEIAADLLGATAPKPPVTLEMIEAEPSYEARANLVRDFVRQDPAKAATVVRQLMSADRNG